MWNISNWLAIAGYVLSAFGVFLSNDALKAAGYTVLAIFHACHLVRTDVPRGRRPRHVQYRRDRSGRRAGFGSWLTDHRGVLTALAFLVTVDIAIILDRTIAPGPAMA